MTTNTPNGEASVNRRTSAVLIATSGRAHLMRVRALGPEMAVPLWLGIMASDVAAQPVPNTNLLVMGDASRAAELRMVNVYASELIAELFGAELSKIRGPVVFLGNEDDCPRLLTQDEAETAARDVLGIDPREHLTPSL